MRVARDRRGVERRRSGFEMGRLCSTVDNGDSNLQDVGFSAELVGLLLCHRDTSTHEKHMAA